MDNMDKKEQIKLDTYEQKEVEFYSASLNAWLSSTMEHDKAILTLSGGGLGLLVLPEMLGSVSSCLIGIFYVIAILFFVTTIFIVLGIYKLNTEHLEAIVNEQETELGPILNKRHEVLLWTFGLGVLFTAFIGLSSVYNSYNKNVKAQAKLGNPVQTLAPTPEFDINSKSTAKTTLPMLHPIQANTSESLKGTATKPSKTK
jgi:hypothetical protein